MATMDNTIRLSMSECWGLLGGEIIKAYTPIQSNNLYYIDLSVVSIATNIIIVVCKVRWLQELKLSVLLLHIGKLNHADTL